MAERRFPIMGGPSIPWSMIEPHEAQAKINHLQSLERLAERGGLDTLEVVCVLEDRKITRRDFKNSNTDCHRQRLMELIEKDQSAELERLRKTSATQVNENTWQKEEIDRLQKSLAELRKRQTTLVYRWVVQLLLLERMEKKAKPLPERSEEAMALRLYGSCLGEVIEDLTTEELESATEMAIAMQVLEKGQTLVSLENLPINKMLPCARCSGRKELQAAPKHAPSEVQTIVCPDCCKHDFIAQTVEQQPDGNLCVTVQCSKCVRSHKLEDCIITHHRRGAIDSDVMTIEDVGPGEDCEFYGTPTNTRED